MPHAVILEHALPDGSTHFDWMLEDPALTGDRTLRTWRLTHRPDRADRFTGDRIGDHRRLYLRFEGVIAGGRGTVRRLNTGSLLAIEMSEIALRAQIDWQEGGFVRYEGRIGADAGWSFRAIRGNGLDAPARL